MVHQPQHDGREGFCCPEPFASPNSPLPPAELAELKACITAANDLLLTLGAPRDPENLRFLRAHLRHMRGMMVRVTLACKDGQEDVVGCLKDAGKDFLQLDTVGEDGFIPFDRLCKVARANEDDCNELPAHTPELLDIDPCLRRDLILRFGEVVSCNPELIQIFFGLRLHQRLLTFIGCRVRVEQEGCGDEPVVGVLCGAEGPAEPRIEVKVENQLRFINLADVCLVRVGPLIRPPKPAEPEPPHAPEATEEPGGLICRNFKGSPPF